jgi:glycosyltransferase involved in cell wall biosynthesis
MSIKVSVVIPVYNAENFIEECIQSLLSQTLIECEFIFVNDGSHDQSRQIINYYQNLDSRIILIDQINKGVSVARNNGLEVAKGEYIGFVDADDFVDIDMFEKLYNTAMISGCDIVFSNFESEIQGHKLITKYPFPIDVSLKKDFIIQNLLPYFIENDDLNSVCNKIFKTKVIYENKIVFPANVALGEDGMFNIQTFSHATNVRYINYTGYHYREVKGSATRNISKKDYFKRALEVYTTPLPDSLYKDINMKKLEKKKAIKLINSVMSYIHIYFTPSKDFAFGKRFKYVSAMIKNRYVQDVLPIYFQEKHTTLGRYQKAILNSIKKQSTLALFFITTYSRLRNK